LYCLLAIAAAANREEANAAIHGLLRQLDKMARTTTTTGTVAFVVDIKIREPEERFQLGQSPADNGNDRPSRFFTPTTRRLPPPLQSEGDAAAADIDIAAPTVKALRLLNRQDYYQQTKLSPPPRHWVGPGVLRPLSLDALFAEYVSALALMKAQDDGMRDYIKETSNMAIVGTIWTELLHSRAKC
jgi:hypothetical protein